MWRFAFSIVFVLLAGCTRPMYVVERATEPYPIELHAIEIAGPDDTMFRKVRIAAIQVFQANVEITIVNATPVTYTDITVWINQRYACPLDALPAGERRTLSLWEFFDQWGQRFPAGGLWRTVEPEPIYLVEFQLDEVSPMVNAVRVPVDV
jgi:hypothetical protein